MDTDNFSPRWLPPAIGVSGGGLVMLASAAFLLEVVMDMDPEQLYVIVLIATVLAILAAAAFEVFMENGNG